MSFNPLLALSALTPPPPDMTEEYDGLEFRWKMLTFRPALFKIEGYFLAAVVAYIAFYFIGKQVNSSRANKWFKSHSALYESQFTKPIQRGGLTQDGNSDFFVFSTGRRAISCLHTTFTLRPRHDLFQLIYQTLWGFVELDYKVYDEIELNFTFKDSSSVPECVWAIVAKDELKNIRNKRWDLTFTKTTDNSALPPSLTVMSEFADITENLLKTHGPLALGTLLSNPAILAHFRSISLTDQPRGRPYHPIPLAERSKHLILTLAVPSSPEETLPLVKAAFQLVDVIAGEGGWGVGRSPASGKGNGVGLNPSLRPETRMKLKKVREELDKELKEDLVKEKREAQEEEKAAAKKKAEEEKLAKLSAADQKKLMERDRKRAMRKTQSKTKVR
ncbi:hypothetical protein EIP91_006715 [Steccherinum ochraceum]|uniref:Coiled-coil domain-containing protein 47 n=1 Tax=Steccherinum ochraceum TaxID=92696 RepID=A0A4R0RZ41_9APHY|nr:hypothetical protein EIP91_006715 [Steccherinum ochraceum]